MDNLKNFKKKKIQTLCQGDINTYDSDYTRNVQLEILMLLKERSLTVSQAKEVLQWTINSLDDHGILITNDEYKKLFGRNPNSFQ